MKVLWINGWGIDSDALLRAAELRYPESTHLCINPTSDWDRLAYQNYQDGDGLVGYSTGAFLLLKEGKLLKAAKRVMLLAPFVDFRQESGLGGKTRRVQLEVLIRSLRKDPIAALNDFYRRAGIRNCEADALPYPMSDLIWGIEQLRDHGISSESLAPYPYRIGSSDALLDAEQIAGYSSRSEVVEGAGHDFRELIADWEGFA